MTSSGFRQFVGQGKRELVNKTLEEDYPGLDFLGFHNVLVAKKRWYCISWFLLLLMCVLCGMFTVVQVIREYTTHPTVTKVEIKSVESLPLPYLTICPTSPTTLNISLILDDLESEFPASGHSEETAKDLANFVLAGSGFQKVKFDVSKAANMSRLYDAMRRAASYDEFFEEYGLQCGAFFNECTMNQAAVSCCEVLLRSRLTRRQIFDSVYTIRRGQCFRLRTALNQTSYDEMGKLTVRINAFSNYDKAGLNEEVIAFVGDEKPEIAPFPRYYVYNGSYVRLMVRATHMSLVEEGDSVCTETSNDMGKSTCYLKTWLEQVEESLGCTYPYMRYIRKTALPWCHPSEVVLRYNSTVLNTDYHRHECVLACNRWEYAVSMERVIDLFYNDLQYEEFTGIYTTSFFGLLSQIGGQLSLFLGTSILSLVQIGVLACIVGRRVVQHQPRGSSVAPGAVSDTQ